MSFFSQTDINLGSSDFMTYPITLLTKLWMKFIFNNQGPMVLLKSNLFHLIFQPTSIHMYHLESQPSVTGEDTEQIVLHLRQLEPNLIGAGGMFFLASEWTHKEHYKIMLLRGEEVQVRIVQGVVAEEEKDELLNSLVVRIMENTTFLMCKILNSCYNPFQEQFSRHGSQIPGMRLTLFKQNGQKGLFIIPEVLVIQKDSDNLKEDILMDIMKGKFYYKQDVVKVEKTADKSLIHFRGKEVVDKNHLKPVTVQPQIGYELACRLSNYYERILTTSQEMFKAWNITISPKSQQMPAMFVDPGFISMQNIEKALNNMIFPVTRSSYNEYYRSNFQMPFEEFPTLQIYICFKESNAKVKAFITSLDKVSNQMQLQISVYKAEQFNISHFIPRTDALYLIITPDIQSMRKSEMRETLVKQDVIYEVVDERDISQSDETLNEVTVLRHLGIITTKFKMAPWKLKNIPFCTQPLSVVSLNIERNNSGRWSVAMCFSLNSLLSKFINLIKEADQDTLVDEVQAMLKQCLQKFKDCHKRFPNRLIIFMNNFNNAEVEFHKEIQDRLALFYGSNNIKSVEVILSVHKACPSLRLYSMKSTLMNPQTVKGTGLLTSLIFSNKLCIQLLQFQALTQFTICHDSNDPQFMKKMSELIVRMAFGSVGGEFGGGLGFLSFSKRLNKFKDVHVTLKWREMLFQGHMLFL